MIAVIDYGTGNLLSVKKALEAVSNQEVVVTSDRALLQKASHIVLPGVGSFSVGMANLARAGMVEALRSEVMDKGKSFLGICLGMQLLAERGEEGEICDGLGFIPGRVRKLDAEGLVAPHLGWNSVYGIDSCSLMDGMDGKDFYFVHNYVFEAPESVCVARCGYGESFVAAVQKDNIFATQFHPEKSRSNGLNLLKAFLQGKTCSRSDWFLSCS